MRRLGGVNLSCERVKVDYDLGSGRVFHVHRCLVRGEARVELKEENGSEYILTDRGWRSTLRSSSLTFLMNTLTMTCAKGMGQKGVALASSCQRI